MKRKISESIKIPEGISCTYEKNIMKFKKGNAELSREIRIPQVKTKIQEDMLSLECEKGNKNQYKMILSAIAHIRNIFSGLNDRFIYELEAVNVHFPMSLKAEGNILVITNFLGEKTKRCAEILPNVDVEIKGQKITVTSSDREAAGQTAANFEKATKIKGRDRRVYQDGIFITHKPRRKK